jgi:hypothetical protein
MRNVSNKNCGENQNKYFMSNNCLWLSLLCDNVEKYCRVGQVTDDHMAHGIA